MAKRTDYEEMNPAHMQLINGMQSKEEKRRTSEGRTKMRHARRASSISAAAITIGLEECIAEQKVVAREVRWQRLIRGYGGGTYNINTDVLFVHGCGNKQDLAETRRTDSVGGLSFNSQGCMLSNGSSSLGERKL